jgi:polysaccharide export outer membrane protein
MQPAPPRTDHTIQASNRGEAIFATRAVIRNTKKMPPKLTSLIVLAAGLLTIAACASSGGKVIDSPAPKLADVQYRIGPGDSLNVFVWDHPELSRDVPVRPDGKVSTPLADDVLAAGKTPVELAASLEKALSEYVRSPKVSVIVTSFQGGDQVQVIGKATRPQSMPYKANMTLLDVMVQVGGLADFAAGNRARIIRKDGDNRVEIPVRLKDLVNKGDVTANLTMMPGDVLIIPETRF